MLGLIAVVLPIVVTEPSRQQLYTAVLAFAICASSLTVLTGWLGQLSLGQMAFAGLAALFAARLVTDGVPFWVAIVTTTVASALLALGIGIGSLRVRGLYLAVVTFVFALTAQQYFYFLPFFSGGLARRRQRPLHARDICGSSPSPVSGRTTTWSSSSWCWSCSC